MPIKVFIQGVIQGVGFRPSVYQIATKNNWNGWILNCGDGVEIVLDRNVLSILLSELKKILPPVASIDSVEKTLFDGPLPEGFEIRISDTSQSSNTKMPSDQRICDQCIQDLFDPKSRFYLYPFVSCTGCGPRYSIIEKFPYDRQNTSMKRFDLCTDCLAGYLNPLDRRYHAEATACEYCGPELSCNVQHVAHQIKQGEIVAIKGIGGYTLIADALQAESIKRLRDRKHRPNKPFAIMSLNIASMQTYVDCDDSMMAALQSGAAPIVLGQRTVANDFIGVADGFSSLGFMLPQTPLHFLLFYHLLGCPEGTNWLDQVQDIFLVVTSGNYSGGVIISDAQEAQNVLSNIASLVVHDNRYIIVKSDDSVLDASNGKLSYIRLAKGYAPYNYFFKKVLPNTLALGTNLKNTISYIQKHSSGSELTVSQHIGDMSSEYSIQNYHDIIRHFKYLFSIKPEIVTVDYHPNSFVGQQAEELGLPCYPVYHHHAHAASVMAEHQLNETCFALILDGYGYGVDDQAWGGELLKCSNTRFERIGCLQNLVLPGGDQAAKLPWRMALSLSLELSLPLPEKIVSNIGHNQINQLQQLIAQQFFPLTSSAGRLFDGVSAYLNICHVNSFEGEAAMRLSSQARFVCLESIIKIVKKLLQSGTALANQFEFHLSFKGWLPDILLNESLSIEHKASQFHEHFIAQLAVWLLQAMEYNRKKSIVLSGGCFQNQHLRAYLPQILSNYGCIVYMNEHFTCNDASISVGQAWVAAHQHMTGERYVFSHSS